MHGVGRGGDEAAGSNPASRTTTPCYYTPQQQLSNLRYLNLPTTRAHPPSPVFFGTPELGSPGCAQQIIIPPYQTTLFCTTNGPPGE